MKVRRRRIISFALLCCACIVMSSCSSAPQEESRVTPRDSAAFLAQELTVSVQEKTSTRIRDACDMSDKHIMLKCVASDSGEYSSELLTYDSDGNMKSTLELTGSQGNPVDGSSLCVDGESLYVLTQDVSSGIWEVLQTSSDRLSISERTEIGIDPGAWVSDFLVMGDDIILLCGMDIFVYRDGELFQQTTIPGDLVVEQIIGNEGKISYLYGDMTGSYFGKWNYMTGVLSKTDMPDLNGIGITGWCESDDAFYINSVSGIYRLDEQSGKIIEVLAWKDTDLPPTRYTYNILKDYILSEDRVLRVISPVSVQTGESPECQLLTHTDKSPAEGKTIVTIGGYDASTDPIMAYAVYQFNLTNDSYRIEIQDYNELHPFEDMSGYNQALVAILADMTKGKGQDILYGDYAFNFNKLDDNELLLNMMPYLEQDKSLPEDAWLPSMYSLMAKDNEMYFFFPSFTMNGFMTNQDYFPESDKITCEDVLSLKRDITYEGVIFSNILSSDLLRGALLYSMDDYIDSNGKFVITVEQLDVLIQYARETGVLNYTPNSSNEQESYLLGQQAMQYSFICCPQDYFGYQILASSPSMYIGYPAQQESARICSPGHQIAISAGSEYPDACWEFVKIMMSPEVQQKVIERNSIPVSRAAFESLLEKAQHPELRTPAENTALDLTIQTAIPAESIAEFRTLVDSINAMTYYDTVLSAIIDETCSPCLYGEKTAADVVNELNERINLYLQE